MNVEIDARDQQLILVSLFNSYQIAKEGKDENLKREIADLMETFGFVAARFADR